MAFIWSRRGDQAKKELQIKKEDQELYSDILSRLFEALQLYNDFTKLVTESLDTCPKMFNNIKQHTVVFPKEEYSLVVSFQTSKKAEKDMSCPFP